MIDLLAARIAARAPGEVTPDAPAKAVGLGGGVWNMGPMLGSGTLYDRAAQRDPGRQREFIRSALAIYHTDRHIKRAEMVIAQRVAGLPWAIEDDEDNPIEGDDGPALGVAARELLSKPTNGKRIGAQPATWRELASITIRHAGLVNVAFWYLDSLNRRTNWPRQILYIRPDRLCPKVNNSGQLDHWGLDESADGKYVRLELDEVLPFYVEPPDAGYYGDGLVQAALELVKKTRLGDTHEIDTLDSGGRLAGIVSPKQPHIGQSLEPDAFDRLQLDIRNIVDLPDAAKRTIVSRAPVDFLPTAADLQKLQTVDLSRLNREEKFGLWGVHPEVAAYPGQAGLNSGERGNYQEATTWQNGCQPRADMLTETLNLQLLARLQTVGLTITFNLKTPTFDDDMPKFDMAQKAEKQPLTQAERRAILDLPPFDDERDDEVWVDGTRIYPAATPAASPAGAPGELGIAGGAAPQSEAAPPTEPTGQLFGGLSDAELAGLLTDPNLAHGSPIDLGDD